MSQALRSRPRDQSNAPNTPILQRPKLDILQTRIASHKLQPHPRDHIHAPQSRPSPQHRQLLPTAAVPSRVASGERQLPVARLRKTKGLNGKSTLEGQRSAPHRRHTLGPSEHLSLFILRFLAVTRDLTRLLIYIPATTTTTREDPP